MTQAMLDTAWADGITLPPAGNMMGRGPDGPGVFVRQGTRMFAAIERCILAHGPPMPIGAMEVLDFGCGVGRVALPFHHRHGQPATVCDVDEEALAYVKSVIPGVTATRTGYTPPTPFADTAFDVVFAISVWTHLPPDLQMPWLAEIRRILRPGGLALITTSSYASLARRRMRLKDWAEVSDEDLAREGMIFKPAGATRGVTGTYGYTLHTADYVRGRWSEIFDVLAIEEGAIEGLQDVNVLRKPAAAARRGGEAAATRPARPRTSPRRRGGAATA